MNEKGQKVHFEPNVLWILLRSWKIPGGSQYFHWTASTPLETSVGVYGQSTISDHLCSIGGVSKNLFNNIYIPFPLYPSAAKLWASNKDLPLSKLIYIHLLDFHSQPLKRVGGNPLPILVQSSINCTCTMYCSRSCYITIAFTGRSGPVRL